MTIHLIIVVNGNYVLQLRNVLDSVTGVNTCYNINEEKTGSLFFTSDFKGIIPDSR